MGQSTLGQENKIKEAKNLLNFLDEEGVDVGISSVTLSELLVNIPEPSRQEFSQNLGQLLCVYPFDISAAFEASRLFKAWTEFNLVGTSEPRQIIKADCQIVGTALAVGASVLYTEDKQIYKLSARRLETQSMLTIQQQELGL